MAKGSDLNKTWIPLSSRPRSQTFNSPSSTTIPYGRYRGKVSGRGGTGNDAVATVYSINYNTNYNVVYPIANQPGTTFSINYNTNYNVAYPIANQPATAFTILYNTNYNVAYPIANQPATAYTILYNTNYNIAYPIANQPESGRPANAWNTNYNVYVDYPIANQPETGRPVNATNPSTSNFNSVSVYLYDLYNNQTKQNQANFLYQNFGVGGGSGCPSPFTVYVGFTQGVEYKQFVYYVEYQCSTTPGNPSAWNIDYTTNYNVYVDYPIANQPVSAWNITYNTNYNIAYPIANRPEASRPVTAWTTNYNIVYPIANRPEASRPATAWTTNYNVIYPIANRPEANRPANAWTTNYNVVYPIANQPEANRPINAYVPGNPGTPATVLGVYFPGGNVVGGVGQLAPYINPTEVVYWSFPDNANYPVAVPPGGQIIVDIE